MKRNIKLIANKSIRCETRGMASFQNIPDDLLISTGVFLDYDSLKEFLKVSSRFHQKAWFFWKEKARYELRGWNFNLSDFDPPEGIIVSPADRYLEFMATRRKIYGRKPSFLKNPKRLIEMGKTESVSFVFHISNYFGTLLHLVAGVVEAERYDLIDFLICECKYKAAFVYEAARQGNVKCLASSLDMIAWIEREDEKEENEDDENKKEENERKDKKEENERKDEKKDPDEIFKDQKIKRYLADAVSTSLKYFHTEILDYAITKGFILSPSVLTPSVKHPDFLKILIEKYRIQDLTPFIREAFETGQLKCLRVLYEYRFPDEKKRSLKRGRLPLKVFREAVMKNVPVDLFDYLLNERKVIFGQMAYYKMVGFTAIMGRMSHLTFFTERSGEYELAAEKSIDRFEDFKFLLEKYPYKHENIEWLMYTAIWEGAIDSLRYLLTKGVKLPPRTIGMTYSKRIFVPGIISQFIELGAKDIRGAFIELIDNVSLTMDDVEALAKNVPQSLVRAYLPILEDVQWPDQRIEILRKYAYPK